MSRSAPTSAARRSRRCGKAPPLSCVPTAVPAKTVPLPCGPSGRSASRASSTPASRPTSRPSSTSASSDRPPPAATKKRPRNGLEKATAHRAAGPRPPPRYGDRAYRCTCIQSTKLRPCEFPKKHSASIQPEVESIESSQSHAPTSRAQAPHGRTPLPWIRNERD